MDPALLAATQGANQIQAPASNLGASQGPELANLYRSSFQLPQSQGAVGAQANVAQQQVDAAKAAQALAEQKQKDLADPSKYRQVASKDGGYNYFDPDGNQIDIATLTQRTGTKPADWLKDSQDPTDIQYLQDQGNLNKFVNAVLGKDKKTVDQFTYADPALKKFVSGKGGVHNLIQQFQQTYKRYYTSDWGALPGNPVVNAPQNDPYYTPQPPNAGSGFKTR